MVELQIFFRLWICGFLSCVFCACSLMRELPADDGLATPKLADLDCNYSVEQGRLDEIVIKDIFGNWINLDKVDQFVSTIRSGKQAHIRYMWFTVDSGPNFTDYDFINNEYVETVFFAYERPDYSGSGYTRRSFKFFSSGVTKDGKRRYAFTDTANLPQSLWNDNNATELPAK